MCLCVFFVMVAQADVLILGGLTDVDAFRSMVALLFHVELARGGMLALRDGGEAVPAGLITRRSQVRLLLPQPFSWGASSSGRTSALQAEGARFESAALHQFPKCQ